VIREHYGYPALIFGAASFFFSMALLVTELGLPFQFGSVKGHVNLVLSDPTSNTVIWATMLVGFLIYPAIITASRSSRLVLFTNTATLILLVSTLVWPAAIPLLVIANILAYLIALGAAERLLGVTRVRAIALSLCTLLCLGASAELLALYVSLVDPFAAMTAYSNAVGIYTAARFDLGLFYIGYGTVVWLVVLLMVFPVILEVVTRLHKSTTSVICSCLAHIQLGTAHIALGLACASALAILVVSLPYSLSTYPIGVDAHWYSDALEALSKGMSPMELARGEPRVLYLLILHGIHSTMDMPIRETMLSGAIIVSVLFVIGSFCLLREMGQGHTVCVLGAFLAGLSAQTLVGTLASIYSNWLALVELLFLFTLLLHAEKTSAKSSLVASWLVSFAVMLTHAWTWIVLLSMLTTNVVLLAIQERSWKPVQSSAAFRTLCASLLTGIVAFVAVSSLPVSSQVVDLGYQWGLLQNLRYLRTPAEFMRDLQIALSNYSTQGLYSNWIMLTLAVIGLFAMRRSEPNARIVLESWILVPALLIFLLGWELQWRLLFLIPYHILAAVGVIASVGTIVKHMEIRAGSRADRLILKAMQWSFIILVFLLFLNNAVRSMTLIAGQVVL